MSFIEAQRDPKTGEDIGLKTSEEEAHARGRARSESDICKEVYSGKDGPPYICTRTKHQGGRHVAWACRENYEDVYAVAAWDAEEEKDNASHDN